MRLAKKINLALLVTALTAWTGLMAAHAEEWKAPPPQLIGTPIAHFTCAQVVCDTPTIMVLEWAIHGGCTGGAPGHCTEPPKEN